MVLNNISNTHVKFHWDLNAIYQRPYTLSTSSYTLHTVIFMAYY